MEIRDLFDFFSSRRRHTRYWRDWSSDVCSSDLTLVPADDGGWVQADRGARTQQATFLCPNEEKEAYVSGEPADDARFVDALAHTLEHAGGYAPGEAKRLAQTRLPDILPYDHRRPVSYR